MNGAIATVRRDVGKTFLDCYHGQFLGMAGVGGVSKVRAGSQDPAESIQRLTGVATARMGVENHTDVVPRHRIFFSLPLQSKGVVTTTGGL